MSRRAPWPGVTALLITLVAAGPLAAQPSPEDTLRAAVERAEASRDSAALAEAHNGLGARFWSEARYAEALAEYGIARAVWSALGDSVGLGRVHNNIGAAHYQWGNLGLALESYLRSLEVREALDDDRGRAIVLANIGVVYRDWGLFDRALPVMEQAVALAERSGVPAARAYTLNTLGMLLVEMGDGAGARAAFEASTAIYQDPANGYSEAEVESGRGLNRHGLARLLLREGRPGEAVEILEELFDGQPLAASGGRQAWPLSDLARGYLALDRTEPAVRALEHALRLSEGATQRPLTVDVLAMLSEAHEARGELGRALDYERRRFLLRESLMAQAGMQEMAAIEFRSEAERQSLENQELVAEQRRQEVVISRQRLAVALGGALLALAVALAGTLIHFNRLGREREALLAESNRELRDAMAEVRTLSGLIPICARCKKVRDEDGYWESVESYVASRSQALFTHGICSTCGPELYGDAWLADEGERPDPAASADESDLSVTR